MSISHQLFQTILLYDTTSTLQHVIYINIPKRRLIVNVPNIVTVNCIDSVACQLREAWTLVLTID